MNILNLSLSSAVSAVVLVCGAQAELVLADKGTRQATIAIASDASERS